MKIGLIADSIERGSPGIKRYTMRLAEELLRLAPDDVTLIRRRPGSHPFFGDKPTLTVRWPLLPLAAKQLLFRLQTAPYGFDVVHDTYHFPPFLIPLPSATIMTVADLTPLLLKTHTLKNSLAHRLLFPQLVKRSHHIIAMSQHTRADLINVLKADPEKVTAIPLAADEHLRPVSDPGRVRELLHRYELPDRFLLALGTVEPRKNLGRVINAFGRVSPKFPDVALAIAGAQGWDSAGLEASARALGVQARVRFLGRVPEEDLAALYSAATALVYPSLYEGFGLPPLEAMQCGCPVITSKVSSLPEVVGDAAILVEPESIADIADAMVRVLTDQSLRLEMEAKGLKRAARFSWRRCAEQTLEVYQGVVGRRAG